MSSVLSGDGVAIHYEVMGSGEPALVFVHGWCCDRSYWKHQAPHFSGSHTIVTVDLAGHGDSGTNRRRWTMSAFGEDVAAVVNQLGLDKVVLIGHSMGGPVIVEAARRLGTHVLGVVAVDTFHDLSRRPTHEQVQQQVSPHREDFTGVTKQMVRGTFVPTSDPLLVEQIAEDMASAPPEVGIGALEGFYSWFRDETRRAFAELSAPVWAINADKRPTNLEAARQVAPSFQLRLMRGLGHFVMLEDPEGFNRALGEVLKEIGKSRDSEKEFSSRP